MRFINKPPIDQLWNLTSSPGSSAFFGCQLPNGYKNQRDTRLEYYIKMHTPYEFHVYLVPISLYNICVCVCVSLQYFPIKIGNVVVAVFSGNAKILQCIFGLRWFFWKIIYWHYKPAYMVRKLYGCNQTDTERTLIWIYYWTFHSNQMESVSIDTTSKTNWIFNWPIFFSSSSNKLEFRLVLDDCNCYFCKTWY